jgi:hypothetical protein
MTATGRVRSFGGPPVKALCNKPRFDAMIVRVPFIVPRGAISRIDSSRNLWPIKPLQMKVYGRVRGTDADRLHACING